MKALVILFFGLTLGTAAQADLVCKSDDGGFAGQPVVLTIDKKAKTATVQVGTETNTIAIDHSVWDGHATGMMTGPGFSFLYNDWYGCIRNAEVTTNIRLNGSVGNIGKVSFDSCTGGSTPDSICYPSAK